MKASHILNHYYISEKSLKHTRCFQIFFLLWSSTWANKGPISASRYRPSSCLCNGRPGLILPTGRHSRSIFKCVSKQNT